MRRASCRGSAARALGAAPPLREPRGPLWGARARRGHPMLGGPIAPPWPPAMDEQRFVRGRENIPLLTRALDVKRTRAHRARPSARPPRGDGVAKAAELQPGGATAGASVREAGHLHEAAIYSVICGARPQLSRVFCSRHLLRRRSQRGGDWRSRFWNAAPPHAPARALPGEASSAWHQRAAGLARPIITPARRSNAFTLGTTSDQRREEPQPRVRRRTGAPAD